MATSPAYEMNGIEIPENMKPGSTEIARVEFRFSVTEEPLEATVKKFEAWIQAAKRNGDKDVSDCYNEAFLFALDNVNLPVMESILDRAFRNNVSISTRDDKNCSLIYRALKNQHFDFGGGNPDYDKMCRWIMDKLDLNLPIGNVTDVNSKKRNMRVLHWAVEQGNSALFDELMKRNVNPDGSDAKDGEKGTHWHDETPGHMAYRLGHFDMLETLLDKGEDPQSRIVKNATDDAEKRDYHKSVLNHAIIDGNWRVVKMCLEHGAYYFSGFDGDESAKVLRFLNPNPEPKDEDRARIWFVGVSEGMVRMKGVVKEKIAEQEALRDGQPAVEKDEKRGWFSFFKSKKNEPTAPAEKEFDPQELLRLKAIQALMRKEPEVLGEVLQEIRDSGGRAPKVNDLPFSFAACMFLLCQREWKPKEGGLYAFGNRGFDGTRLACVKKVFEFSKGEDELAIGLRNGFAHETSVCQGMNLSHWAVMFDEPFALGEFLKMGVPWQSSPAYASAEPAVLAVRGGKTACLDVLLGAGMDPCYPTREAGALGEALRKQDAVLVKKLMSVMDKKDVTEIAKSEVGKHGDAPEVASLMESSALMGRVDSPSVAPQRHTQGL